jgi:S1-C subfamily serine protease
VAKSFPRSLTAAFLLVGTAAVVSNRAFGQEHANQDPASYAALKGMSATERLAQASVIVVPKACAGAVVESTSHVLTAAHCVPQGMIDLPVKLRDGREVNGKLEFLDETRDLALLHLEEPARAVPLKLALDAPRPGQRVQAFGRFDRAQKAQKARVERLGRCPSLPGVDDAVFTTINAKPGDSGGPIVNRQFEVVAVIHGGAACHIAAPVYPLARVLAADDDGELGPTPPAPAPLTPPSVTPPAAPSAPLAAPGSGGGPVLKTYRFGPLTFEKRAHGFSLRFAWSIGDRAKAPTASP